MIDPGLSLVGVVVVIWLSAVGYAYKPLRLFFGAVMILGFAILATAIGAVAISKLGG